MSDQNNIAVPKIASVAADVHRPLWSVMIPTFNCAKYLAQAMRSVLAQDPGPDQMQVEVVDDCSTEDDPEAVVQKVGNGRVAFFRQTANQGLAKNFNTCIARARGDLIHILHGDDFVLANFYAKVTAAANSHPEAALIASRSFFVDEEGIILAVTDRLKHLEGGSRRAEDFFYATPIQTPGVVVRRAFYESQGGFLPALSHVADCEMWARAIGIGGGVILPEILACYRMFSANDSGRLARRGENLRDIERLNEIFAKRFPLFDRRKAKRRVCNIALGQVGRFAEEGDTHATKASLDFWKKNAPLDLRLRRLAGKLAKAVFK